LCWSYISGKCKGEDEMKMTNEKALEIIKNQLAYWKLVAKNYPKNRLYKDNVGALQMAVEALEKEE